MSKRYFSVPPLFSTFQPVVLVVLKVRNLLNVGGGGDCTQAANRDLVTFVPQVVSDLIEVRARCGEGCRAFWVH